MDPDKQTNWAYNCEYFHIHQIKHLFWAPKRTMSFIRLLGTVLLSACNICFDYKIKKLLSYYPDLSGGLFNIWAENDTQKTKYVHIILTFRM